MKKWTPDLAQIEIIPYNLKNDPEEGNSHLLQDMRTLRRFCEHPPDEELYEAINANIRIRDPEWFIRFAHSVRNVLDTQEELATARAAVR